MYYKYKKSNTTLHRERTRSLCKSARKLRSVRKLRNWDEFVIRGITAWGAPSHIVVIRRLAGRPGTEGIC